VVQLIVSYYIERVDSILYAIVEIDYIDLQRLVAMADSGTTSNNQSGLTY